MKTPLEGTIVILLTFVSSNMVLGSNGIECKDGQILISGVKMEYLEVKVPKDCDTYTTIWITKSRIDTVNSESVKWINNYGVTLELYNNHGTIDVNADFRSTGITKYYIDSNFKIELGNYLRFHADTMLIQLYNNKITKIPRRIFKDLKKLEGLNLNLNELTSLDIDTFQGLDQLRILKLHGNQLTTISSGTFQRLPKLENLDLANNRITEIRADPFSFRPDASGFLPAINVIGNPLKHLERCLADLKNFKFTNISELKFTGKPDPSGASAEEICKVEDKQNYPSEALETIKTTTVNHPFTTTKSITETRRETFSEVTIDMTSRALPTEKINMPDGTRPKKMDKPGGSTPRLIPTVPEKKEEIYLFFFWGVFVVTALIFLLIAILVSKRVALRHLQSSRVRINGMSSVEKMEMQDLHTHPGVIKDLTNAVNERQKKNVPKTHSSQKQISSTMKKSVKGPQVAMRGKVTSAKGKKGVTPFSLAATSGQSKSRFGEANSSTFKTGVSNLKTLKSRQMANRTSSKKTRVTKATNPHSIAPASRNISKRKSTQVKKAKVLKKQTSKNKK